MDESFIANSMDKFGLSVLKIASSITGNTHDAEDVFSDTFFALWQAQKTFESDKHIEAWLIRVAVNKAKNIKKQAFYKYRTELHDNIQYISNSDSDKDVSVNLALQQLKPKERAIVYLHYYQGYNYKEIGDMLKMKESGVRVKAMRARKKMRDTIDECELKR